MSSVGLAIPGPYLRYGVLGHSANMPASFEGWDFNSDYSRALAKKVGRAMPLVVGNDGAFGGVGEAQRVRGTGTGGVLMLAPGLGPGHRVHRRARPAAAGRHAGGHGDRAHAGGAAPAGREAVPRAAAAGPGAASSSTRRSPACPTCWPRSCPPYPDHPLATSTQTPKEKALALRGLAQKGDALAVELFDFQARAMGLHIANLVLALDPEFVVIGGGLMDPENTTDAFRARYLDLVRETARPHLWPVQRERLTIVPSTLGELSQAIGAALVALYRSRR